MKFRPIFSVTHSSESVKYDIAKTKKKRKTNCCELKRNAEKCGSLISSYILLLLFTLYDKLYVWWIPVLQFVIAVERARDAEEDLLRLNSKTIRKIWCDNFSILRNEKWIFCCAFCLLFLLFAVCFRCVRTRLLFYIGVFWQSEIIWCMRIAQFISKLNSKMNTKSSWGDLFNGICSSQIS